MSEAHIGKRTEVVKIPDAEKILSMGEDRIRELMEGLSGEDLKKAKKNLKEALKSLPKKEQEYWEKYVSEKGFKKRDLLKFIGAAVAAGVGVVILNELFGEKGQKEEEITPAEKEKKFEEEFDIEKASKTELIEELAKYPKAIKENPEKRTLSKFARVLSEEKFDCLVFGERESQRKEEATEMAEILEGLIENNKKISAIGLEDLSWDDDVTRIDEFNKGLIPADKMLPSGEKKALFELARKHSIEIVGLEEKGRGRITTDYDVGRKYDVRSKKEIIERVEKLTREKKKEDIVVILVKQKLATTDGWENVYLSSKLEVETPHDLPSKEEASENEYTIKERFQKGGVNNAVVVQVEPWIVVTKDFDTSLNRAFGRTAPGEREAFVNSATRAWENLILKEKDPFVVKYPRAGEGVYALVMPYDVPEVPPSLAGYFKKRK